MILMLSPGGPWYVYALEDCGTVFYVGMTSRLAFRAVSHTRTPGPVLDRIRKTEKEGGFVTMRVLALCATADEARWRESHEMRSRKGLINRQGYGKAPHHPGRLAENYIAPVARVVSRSRRRAPLEKPLPSDEPGRMS